MFAAAVQGLARIDPRLAAAQHAANAISSRYAPAICTTATILCYEGGVKKNYVK